MLAASTIRSNLFLFMAQQQRHNAAFFHGFQEI